MTRGDDCPRLQSSALLVNVDRALLRTDPSHERVFALATKHPATLVSLVLARLRGRDSFRQRLVAEGRGDVRVSGYPREPEVERLIEDARQQGKPVGWLSSAPLRWDEADHQGPPLLGEDDEILDGSQNWDDQVARLRSRHPDGFAYVGQHAGDLPLWRAARERYAVNLPTAVRRQAEREGLGLVELGHRRALPIGLLRAMRPHQWLKNLLVFVPFALDLNHLGPGGVARALLAFACLCLLTSGTYLVNDMFDVEADRRHPRKRKRPIAAGDVPIPVAAAASAALVAGALLVALILRPVFAGALASYLVLTLAYSFKLKRMAMVDVLVIAMLFTLRILAGMLLTSAVPSQWLLMFSIFFFLSLAFMKREVEFNVMHRAGRQVLSGRGYAMEDRMYVLSCGLSSGMASIVIFALFINDTGGAARTGYGTPALLWGAVFCLSYWILRMWLLTTRGLMNDDPILFAAKDRTSLLLGGASVVIAALSQVLTL